MLVMRQSRSNEIVVPFITDFLYILHLRLQAWNKGRPVEGEILAEGPAGGPDTHGLPDHPLMNASRSALTLILMRGREAVRRSGIINFFCAFYKLCRLLCRVLNRNDLVVLAVQTLTLGHRSS